MLLTHADDARYTMATVSQRASYHDDPLVMAKLEKHQLMAVACLVVGDLAKLDPTIGDASCQVRALIMLVFYYDLRKELGDKWANAVDFSDAYLTAHENDKSDTKAKTIQDITGGIHAKDFDDLVDFVRNHIMGEEKFELLGLAHSLWTAGILSTDEFWIDFRYRSNNLWGTHDKSLKARLATLSCDIFVELAKELPAEGKWVEALLETRSVIKRCGAENVPVLSIQATFAVAMALLYQRRIPLLDGNVRIQLTGDGQPRLPDPSDRSDNPEPPSNITYTLGAQRSMLYVANEKSGTFALVKTPVKEQMLSPAFFLKSWSTYYEGSTDQGLYSASHEAYYAARANISMPWAVDVYTALHPPFSRSAVDADLDIIAAFEKVFPVRGNSFKYSRFDLQGLNHLVPLNERPNLAERQNLAMRVAHVHHLNGDCQFVRMGAPSETCTSRINRCIDWQIVHVLAATPKWVDDNLRAIATRHEEAEGAVIGPYVFTLGAVGASHEIELDATKLHNIKKEPARRKRYLDDYPNNEPLLDPVDLCID